MNLNLKKNPLFNIISDDKKWIKSIYYYEKNYSSSSIIRKGIFSID